MSDGPRPRFERALRLVVLVVPVLGALWFAPSDDGLRHVGVAFGAERSWGEVYPFSTFARFDGYDPWWGYDVALGALGKALSLVVADRLDRQFVATEIVSAIFLGALLGLAIRGARLDETIRDGYDDALAVLLVAFVLTDSIERFAAIRPFAFGTLLLLYGVGARGFARGFVAAALTTALYPYLAWIYVGALVLAHLWRGSRSFAAGAGLASLAGASFHTAELVGLVRALGASGRIRAELASSFRIGELAPASGSLGLVVLVLLGVAALVPVLPPERRRLRVEHVVALLFVPVAFVHVRYLVDVVVPLLFVAYAADALRVLRRPFARAVEAWREKLAPSVRLDGRPSPALRVVLALAYTALFAALGARSLAQHEKLASMHEALRAVPRGSLVLTRFNLQYRMLYARPDLSLVPSCELGFPDPAVVDPYLAYFRDGRVCTLARRIEADFFVEPRAGYVDPTDGDCLVLVEDGPDVRIWRVEPGEAGT